MPERRLPLTDTARSYAATAICAVLGGGLLVLAGFTSFAGGPYFTSGDVFADPAEYISLVYLFLWPMYCLVYALLVWIAYRDLPSDVLARAARRDLREGRRLVTRLLGEGGAVSSSVTVSAAAVVVTVLVAQSGLLQRSPVLLILAFLTVGGSWLVMVLAFALAYLRLNEASEAPAGGLHLEVASPRPYRFDDYVTVALLASTMAATISVAPRTRAGWRMLRANVAVAFAFNSVVIAMVVSLLIGGLTV